jgi:general secretion pathway protein D
VILNSQRLIRCVVLLLVLSTVLGCAAKQAFREGEKRMRRQDYDQAVLDYSRAVALKPANSRYSVSLSRAKLRSAGVHFEKGRRFSQANQLELAIAEFQQVLLLNPGHQYAANELGRAAKELQRQQAGPSEIEQIKEQARRLQMGPPKLDPRTNIPILLNFQEVEVQKIFEAISKVSGINFIFDDKTDLAKPMTIDIGNVTLEKALDIIMLQTKNFYKPIDNYTLLIAPDTRQKRQEYEDQVIQTFFLSNADTKQAVTLLRSLLQSRQIAENADLNTVTIKDTPDKVAIAERIISTNDKSKGEVLIDVELLEINRTTAHTIGIDLSAKTLSLTFRDGQASVGLNDLGSLKQTGNWTIGIVPSVILNFLKSDSDSRLLAKPQLRVSEGEQAEILIGNRIPVPTTSFNTSQTIGGNIVPITSFTYQNVGITVQMEPRVHHNKEVTLRVQVEFSQVTGTVNQGGQTQPIIGTRQIQTVIRLRDGETNMMAGLIQRTAQDSTSGVAGLSDIPGMRHVFGSTDLQSDDTDIIMTITPRIIRIPDFDEQDLATLWVGTEDNMQLRGPARDAYGRSPFGPASDVTVSVEPIISGGSTGAAGSGAVNRISTSTDAPTPTAGSPSGAAARRSGQAQGSPDGAQSGGENTVQDAGGTEPASGEPTDPTSGGPTAPSGPAAVRVVPSKSSYRVGEEVVVDVMIENATNVASVPFHLRYERDVLDYVGGEKGGFMKKDGKEPVFLAAPVPQGGEIVVGLSRLGAGSGLAGSGLLARFRFMALAPGQCGFAFSGASVKDPQARNLPAQFVTVPVTIE